MAMRLRQQADGTWVALCAATDHAADDDVYLDDAQDHALREKLRADFASEGFVDIQDYKERLFLSDADRDHLHRYDGMDVGALEERAITAAAFWLDASPHEMTLLDGLVCALYTRKAIGLLATMRQMLSRRTTQGAGT